MIKNGLPGYADKFYFGLWDNMEILPLEEGSYGEPLNDFWNRKKYNHL